MGLTAFPTVVFNASAGSDTAASGAGPSTAVTGTCAASTNTTTVTFQGTPDLSGVAQDGSHVLWVSGVGFVRISTVDNSAKTCVVETALTIASGTAFAIGGKRATFDNAESRRLFAATASPTASGGSGQWAAVTETDQTVTTAVPLTFTAGTGSFVIAGDSTSARRTVTQTGASQAIFAISTTNNRGRVQNLVFRHSNAAKNAAFTANSGLVWEFENCLFGAADGTNCPSNALSNNSGGNLFIFRNCAVLRTTSNGIVAASGTTLCVSGCDVYRCAGNGINASVGTLIVEDTVVSYNTSNGIASGLSTIQQIVRLDRVTSHANGAAGWLHATNNQDSRTFATNCQFTGNSTYGVNFSGTTPNAPIIEGCNAYGNTTSDVSGVTLSAGNTSADPQYVDPTGTVRNFAVSGTVATAGYPARTATIGAGQSGTTTYIAIGAAQPQAGGRASGIFGGGGGVLQ